MGPSTEDFAVKTIRRTFFRAASSTFLDEIMADHRQSGAAAAILARDSGRLFSWLMTTLSFQGISNRVASAFIESHGQAEWPAVQAILQRRSRCGKLASYWHFEDCGYRKEAQTCAMPALLKDCGLPKLPLRNGRLNQTAISLFLFIRDIASGDLVTWIDKTLDDHSDQSPAQRAAALLEPMRGIFGVSDKMLSMLLASILLGAGRKRQLWFETGASFVVVDTLVHNYLHRSGVLAATANPHPYGVRCYEPDGCADIIQRAALQIDASLINRNFPAVFPRLVQHALWRFCAIDEIDACNGTRIDDRTRCQNRYCLDFPVCPRIALT